MRSLLIILIVVLTNVSCQRKQLILKPNKTLSETEMTDILVDYFIAKGYNEDAQKDKRILTEEEIISPSAYIYKKYNIDSLQFAQNMNYYLTKKETILTIFENAEKKLKAREALYTGEVKKTASLQKNKTDLKLEKTKNNSQLKKTEN